MSTVIQQEQLHDLLFSQLEFELQNWLADRIAVTISTPSSRDLFMTYSMIGRKFSDKPLSFATFNEDHAVMVYGKKHSLTVLELARIYLLFSALTQNPDYFVAKIGTLMQVADTGELIVFLRYLWILPSAKEFTSVAVDALRTNIADVFDAIALDNPYPREYFNEGQWNQMYLKAAFMQRDLLKIAGTEERANANLSRIISDYAHERWAASRTIDPQIWKPVAAFLDDTLLSDMKRLLESANPIEQRAGFLCCNNATDSRAKMLISRHPIKTNFESESFNWNTLTL